MIATMSPRWARTFCAIVLVLAAGRAWAQDAKEIAARAVAGELEKDRDSETETIMKRIVILAVVLPVATLAVRRACAQSSEVSLRLLRSGGRTIG